jgi:tRNA pseudouridine13 synthase
MVKLTGYFRFTDFLVNEVGLDGEVLRLKSIGKPVDPYDVPKDKSKGKEKDKEKEKPEAVAAPSTSEPEAVKEEPKQEAVQAEIANDEDLPESLRFKPLPLWTASTTRALRPTFSDESIAKLYALLVEGKEPPPKVDSGWGTRKARVEVAVGNEEAALNVNEEDAANASAPSAGGGRGQGRDRGRGRGGRGGRGGGRAGDNGQWSNATKDDREVLSQVSYLRNDGTGDGD